MPPNALSYPTKGMETQPKTEKSSLKFGSVAVALSKIEGLVAATKHIAQYAPRAVDKANALKLVSELSEIVGLLSNISTALAALESINENLAKGVKLKDINSQSVITQTIAKYFPINSDSFGLQTNSNLGGVREGSGNSTLESPEFNAGYLNNLLLILAYFENAKEKTDGSFTLTGIAHTRGQDNPDTIRKHSYAVIEITDKEISFVESFVTGNALYIIDMRNLKAEISTTNLSPEQIRRDILDNSKTDLNAASYSTRVEHYAGYEDRVIGCIEELFDQRERDREIVEICEREETEVTETIDQPTTVIQQDNQHVLDRLKGGTMIEIVEDKPKRREQRTYEQRISELLEFVKNTGNVPSESSKDREESCLAVLFYKLKSGLNFKGKLTAEDKLALEEAGYSFETKTPRTYEETISELLDFVKRNGTLPKANSSDDEMSLYSALINLRIGNTFKDRFSDEDKQKLRDVGYTTEKMTKTYEETISELLKFVEINGFIPNKISENKEEVSLFEAFTGLKLNNRFKDQLADQDKKALESVGYSFEIRKTRTYEEMVSELLEFAKRYGVLPNVNSEDKIEASLGGVFSNLKSDNNYEGRITEEDKLALEAAGYNFEVQKTRTYKETIEGLLAFPKDNDGRLPLQTSKNKDESRLANAFRSLKKGASSKDEFNDGDKQRLRDAGYDFEKRSKTYEQTINDLLGCIDRFGGLPKTSSDDPQEVSLAFAFSRLKNNKLFKGKFTDEDKQKLREVGYKI